jgi:hypothetical protein
MANTAHPVTPVTLGGGVYLQTKQYNHSTHIDTAHVLQINQRGGLQPTNLGVVEYFIQSGFMDDMGTVYDFGKMGKNRVAVTNSNGLYQWEQREAMDDFYIVEDLSGSATPGIDEQPFKLRYNRMAVGNLAVISADKFAQYDLVVTQDEIVKDGDTWIYTVVPKGLGTKNAWYPKSFLTAGTKYVQKTSVHGANTTTYNTLGDWGSKTSTYYNYVGQMDANIHFVVGGKASGMQINSEEVKSIQEYQKVMEMWVFRAGSDAFDAQLRGKDPVKEIYGGDIKKASKDIVGSAWLSAVEALAIKRLELDIEQEAFWGTGGTVTMDGYTYYSPIGLYHQFNRGNQHFFDIRNLTLEKIDGILASFFSGRKPSFGTEVFELVVGEGMASLLRQLTKGLAAVNGMITNSERFLTGMTNDLHFHTPVITAYDFTFGTVRWRVNPALNPIVANDAINPYVGNYRLSSYMAMVIDVTGEDNNIQELYHADGWDFMHQYYNGKGNYMGNPVGFQGDMNQPYDFKVAMRKKHKAYRLVDPTKSFIIKPYNPSTGKPFGFVE